MSLAKWTAYGCFGMAVLCVIMAIANEAPAFLGAGLGVLFMGVGFLAAHQALVLLTEIRNALAPVKTTPNVATVTTDAATPARVRTAAEFSADISAMKARAWGASLGQDNRGS